LIKQGKSKVEIEAFNKKYPSPEHPVIRTHPDTEQKVIYVNKAFTQYIKDWDAADSSIMLDFLYAQAAIPEYQCRFIWEKDSIAFWDNRACQHYAVSDYWPQVRKVERVTVVGDRPY
jgi:taurine dioxygenase